MFLSRGKLQWCRTERPGQARGLEHDKLWRCRQQGINWGMSSTGHMVFRVVTLVPLLYYIVLTK